MPKTPTIFVISYCLLKHCASDDTTRLKLLNIIDGPVANAGIGQTFCANTTSILLNGSVENATGGIWSGGANTFSTVNTDLTTSYRVDAADTATGSVTLGSN